MRILFALLLLSGVSLAQTGFTNSNLDNLNAAPAKANLLGIGMASGFADPNADRILFWDDSAGSYAPLTLGTNLSITGTTIDAAGGAGSTDLSYTAATRLLASSSGADATLPLFTTTEAGLTPLSGGGTTNFLRADGTWAAPAGGSTNLTYTASSRLLESSTGTDATLPLFTTTAAGLVPASGGGTTNFLRADGSWAAASGSGIGDFLADGSVPMTGDLNLNGNDITGINTFTTTTLNATNFQISSTAVTATAAELNFVDGVTSAIQTQIDSKAPNTGTLTGTHTTPSTSNPLAPTWTGPMHVVFYGATGEIDLPAAAGYTGRGIAVYNTGSFTVSIDPNGSEVIVRDGTVQTGGVTMTLSSGAGNFVTLLSDGTRWVTFGFKGTLGAGS